VILIRITVCTFSYLVLALYKLSCSLSTPFDSLLLLNMPWYSSWIPDLPNINFGIPGIQGRFVSFVLKKSLGHLLKPGQLDSHQIDSQIGSGYVQINDLELNPEVCLFQMCSNPVLMTLFKGNQFILSWSTHRIP
jgi:hypothetical protein